MDREGTRFGSESGDVVRPKMKDPDLLGKGSELVSYRLCKEFHIEFRIVDKVSRKVLREWTILEKSQLL